MIVARSYEDRRLRIMAEEARGPRVLDLGYAHSPNPYLVQRRELQVTGVDLEPTTDSGYHDTLCADVTQLPGPLGERRFDSVLAGELIEHLEDPYDFLRRTRDLLAPGGRIVLSTPNPLSFPMVICELAGDRKHFYSKYHTYSFPPRWVERMLAIAGFELLRTRAVGLWCPGVVIPWAPTTLSYQNVYVATPKPASA
jgi:2-polyprenyl-3-methyl-5-hydroxy-6-metoxy-1,4-benzoquinol methylase